MTVAPLALLDVLTEVTDPRDPRGIRHPLSAILALTVLAMLSGANTLTAIAQFGNITYCGSWAETSKWWPIYNVSLEMSR